MSPGLARYFAFSGNARRAARVSLWAAAISLSVSPAFTVTVTIGGRRIAFARAMTRLTRASRMAGDPQLEPDTVFQHYSLPAYDAGREAIAEPGAGIRSSKLAVPRGSVLLSKLNPEIERVWLPDIRLDDRAICSTEFLVLRPCVGVGRAFVYEFLRSAPFRSTLTSLVTGTTGSHQRAHAEAILQVPLRLPGPSRAAQFERIVGPMLHRVAVARRESRTLVALRDALLPRLLSGETSPSFGRGQGA